MIKVKSIIPPSFEFEIGNQKYRVPTIQAYNFSEEEIRDFKEQRKFVPLILDANIENICTINCLYCFTSKGKKDRFDVSQEISRLSDSELEEIASQFGSLGGRSFFICSEGEPLGNTQRFIRLARIARDSGLEVVTYTNAVKIDKKLASVLHNLGVNLVLKLESLSPNTNEQMLSSKGQYSYVLFKGQKIPRQIAICLEEYSQDREKLAISSIATGVNYDDLLDLRRWAFSSLGICHFLKKLYVFGEAEKNKDILCAFNEQEVSEAIYEFDKSFGFSYPQNVSDTYSFDIRRFTNNYINSRGFPIRVFGHPRGGVYHNSEAVKPNFGFRSGILVSMRDTEGKINLEEYFRTIQEHIEKIKSVE